MQWKYQHFHSRYALMKNTDFFHRIRWNIFGIHLKKVNILYLLHLGTPWRRDDLSRMQYPCLSPVNAESDLEEIYIWIFLYCCNKYRICLRFLFIITTKTYAILGHPSYMQNKCGFIVFFHEFIRFSTVCLPLPTAKYPTLMIRVIQYSFLIDIFQLHITLRFVRQRRLTLEFILEGRCQQ